MWACALDPSATIAVTASADFSAKIWDALTGLERASLPHSHIVRTAAFSPDSARLVTGGHEKILRVFDVDRPDAPTELATAAGPIRALACLGGGSSGGLVLGTVSDMPGVPLWDARAGGLVRTLPTAGAVTAIDVRAGAPHALCQLVVGWCQSATGSTPCFPSAFPLPSHPWAPSAHLPVLH